MTPLARNPPSTDEQLPGHEAGRVGGEIDGGADELFEPAEPFHRRANEELLPARPFEERRVEIGLEHAGRDGVDREAVRRPLDRERARQSGDGGLSTRYRR